jgi:photosystem II stability/assembly factor-like uncharacterized protein
MASLTALLCVCALVLISRGTAPIPPTVQASPAKSMGAVTETADYGGDTANGDTGLLQQFTPVTADVSWAVVASNLTPTTYVVRTTDGGSHWQDVTPPVHLIGSSDFLSAEFGWIVPTALTPPPIEQVYRTNDGGRTWQALGRVPTACQLDFVNQLDGWCTVIGAALGSESVTIYRTVDGGETWSEVSRSGDDSGGTVRGALPFGCDKSVSFTPPSIGWAAFSCNGGIAPLYTSSNGGATWQSLSPYQSVNRKSVPDGSLMGPPVVQHGHIAVALELGGPRGGGVISSSADGGKTWRARSAPALRRPALPDLITPSDWILTDGTSVWSTDDAGLHWNKWTPAVSMLGALAEPLHLDFLSSRLGWAAPDANGGPLWRTTDGGHTWKKVVIRAGPFSIPPTASTTALISQRADDHPAIVWRNAPAPTPDPMQLARHVPECLAERLSAQTLPSGGTAGAIVFRVQIVNKSDEVCALRGHPVSLTGITGDGTAISLNALYMSNGVPYVTDQPAILPVGASADMAIVAPVNCTAGTPVGPTFRSLDIGLSSGAVSAPYATGGAAHDQPLAVPCPIAVTPFARWDASEGNSAHFSGDMALLATLPESFSLRPGQQQVKYVVTLANPTATAIALRPCPTYTETLEIQTSNGIRPGPNRTEVASYRLNCSRTPEVDGHSSLRFAMEVRVPRLPGESPGGTLQWRLNVLDGTGPEASTYWCGACTAPAVHPGSLSPIIRPF